MVNQRNAKQYILLFNRVYSFINEIQSQSYDVDTI
jgi:hypothetical protein